MHFTPFFTLPKNKKLLFKIASSSRRGGKKKNQIKTYPVAHKKRKKNTFRTITHPNNLDAASLNAGVGIKLSPDRLESLGTHGNYERRPSTGRDAFFCILLFHEAKLIAVPLDFSPISLSLSGREPICMHPLENARFRKSEPDDERERAKGQVARVFIHGRNVCAYMRERLGNSRRVPNSAFLASSAFIHSAGRTHLWIDAI